MTHGLIQNTGLADFHNSPKLASNSITHWANTYAKDMQIYSEMAIIRGIKCLFSQRYKKNEILEISEISSNFMHFLVIWLILGHRSYTNVSGSMYGRNVSTVKQSTVGCKFKVATSSGLYLMSSLEMGFDRIHWAFFTIIFFFFRFTPNHGVKMIWLHQKSNVTDMIMKWFNTSIQANISQFTRKISCSSNIWKRIRVKS